MERYIQVFTTTENKEEAKKISRKLVENKLASCVQITKIESVYRWEEKIEETEELLLIIKTKKEMYNQIEKTIKETHSYKTPEIIAIEISEGSKEYLDWIRGSVKI